MSRSSPTRKAVRNVLGISRNCMAHWTCSASMCSPSETALRVGKNEPCSSLSLTHRLLPCQKRELSSYLFCLLMTVSAHLPRYDGESHAQARCATRCLSLLPSIEGDGLFSIGPAAGADNAGQFVDIKGHVTKGDAQTRSFRSDDGVIGPGIYPHTPVREVGHLPVIGQADAARIEIPGVAQAPHLLRVGMPSGKQRGIGATQELPHHLIWRLGQNDLVEGTR